MLNSKAVNIVWLKRDLRSQDHAPLLKAECAGIPYIIIYLFEPSRIDYPVLQIASPITKFCPVYTILNKLMPETDPIQNGK